MLPIFSFAPISFFGILYVWSAIFIFLCLLTLSLYWLTYSGLKRCLCEQKHICSLLRASTWIKHIERFPIYSASRNERSSFQKTVNWITNCFNSRIACCAQSSVAAFYLIKCFHVFSLCFRVSFTWYAGTMMLYSVKWKPGVLTRIEPTRTDPIMKGTDSMRMNRSRTRTVHQFLIHANCDIPVTNQIAVWIISVNYTSSLSWFFK